MPTGTYVDMCSKLPLIDPAKVTSPTLIMRGEYDGIASLDDLLNFYISGFSGRGAPVSLSAGNGRELRSPTPILGAPLTTMLFSSSYYILH